MSILRNGAHVDPHLIAALAVAHAPGRQVCRDHAHIPSTHTSAKHVLLQYSCGLLLGDALITFLLRHRIPVTALEAHFVVHGVQHPRH